MNESYENVFESNDEIGLTGEFRKIGKYNYEIADINGYMVAVEKNTDHRNSDFQYLFKYVLIDNKWVENGDEFRIGNHGTTIRLNDGTVVSSDFLTDEQVDKSRIRVNEREFESQLKSLGATSQQIRFFINDKVKSNANRFEQMYKDFRECIKHLNSIELVIEFIKIYPRLKWEILEDIGTNLKQIENIEQSTFDDIANSDLFNAKKIAKRWGLDWLIEDKKTFTYARVVADLKPFLTHNRKNVFTKSQIKF